jgi:acetyl esterase
MNLIDTDCLPETTEFNARFAAANQLDRGVTLDAATLAALRRNRLGTDEPAVRLPQGHDRTVAGIGVREFRPPEFDGVYLHIHGGGWMIGAADVQDTALRALADATGLVAASVEYRLAPEHPFPAAIDDCERAARWVLAGNLDTPAHFAIGGESAGAHLSALVLQRVRGFAAANLAYGAYDLSLTPSVRRWGDRNLVLSRPIIEHFVAAFVRDRDPRAPEISPLYADLASMPPALFTVGALDPLLDDTLFMYERWRAAGNAAELRVWPHAVHGFNGFELELGRLADRDQHAWLATV